MIMAMAGIYSLYVLIMIYTSVMQIGYINLIKRKTPVLLSAADFLQAGNYAVAKEKLSIVNTFVDYLVFIMWIGFGIKYLVDQYYTMANNEAMMNVAIVMSFVVINYIISLPFSYYEKFVIDEKFGLILNIRLKKLLPIR